jgi:hypothetical protein
MTVSVVVPFTSSDDTWRADAREFVLERIHELHPAWEVIEGVCDGEWSKGAAIADGVARAAGGLLVLHDADSFTVPDNLAEAVEHVATRTAPWVIPHSTVHRLRDAETLRVLAGERPRLGAVIRQPYEGPMGGGIVVLTRAAFDAVGGIDDRFLGWGGEDLSFGWALETLVGQPLRLSSPLVHLWHPHPAPDLRGSPASEELVAAYRAARGLRRRMAQLVQRQPVTDPTPLERPVTFRMNANRTQLRIAEQFLRFTEGRFTTTDPDLVDALRVHPLTVEVSR